MVILWDLDMTIANTNKAKGFREKEETLDKAIQEIPNFTPAYRIIDFIKSTRKKGVKHCIVTTSRRKYVKAVLEKYGLGDMQMVCYDDLKSENGRKTVKPNAQHMKQALESIKYCANKDGEIYLIGDDVNHDLGLVNNYNETYGSNIRCILASWFHNETIKLLEDKDGEKPSMPYYACREESSLIGYFRNMHPELFEEEQKNQLLRRVVKNVYQMLDYNSFKEKGNKLEARYDTVTEKIRNFKHNKVEDTLTERFVAALKTLPINWEKTLVCVVPSSTAGKWSESVEQVVETLVNETDCINGTSYLYRWEDAKKAHQMDGVRSKDTALRTIAFDLEAMKRDIEKDAIESVLILDDILTSGSTMGACMDIAFDSLKGSYSITEENMYAAVVAGTTNWRGEATGTAKNFLNEKFYCGTREVILDEKEDYDDLQKSINNREYDESGEYEWYRQMLKYDKQSKKKLQWITTGYMDSCFSMDTTELKPFDSYEEAEVEFMKGSPKEYMIIRCVGKQSLETEMTTWSQLQYECGKHITACEVKKKVDTIISNLGSEEEREGISVSEEATKIEEGLELMPTLFRMVLPKVVVKNKDGVIPPVGRIPLDRIYDDNIVTKFLKRGVKLNAFLPRVNLEKADSEGCEQHCFTDDSKEHTLPFPLPTGMVDRMLVMKLTTIEKGLPTPKLMKHCFAKVTFINSVDRWGFEIVNKGYFEFTDPNYKYQDYNELSGISPEKKSLVLYDEEMNRTFLFECEIEQLPIPGETTGNYAYVDGSSTKDKKKEQIFGAGVVLNIGEDVFFGRKKGEAKGANYSGELVAATIALEQMTEMSLKKVPKRIRILFDNVAIGYKPLGIHDKKSAGEGNVGKNYMVAVDAFRKKYPNTILEFIHVDGHTKIMGNEMADYVAQVNKEQLEQMPEFSEARGEIFKDSETQKEPKTQFVGPFHKL